MLITRVPFDTQRYLYVLLTDSHLNIMSTMNASSNNICIEDLSSVHEILDVVVLPGDVLNYMSQYRRKVHENAEANGEPWMLYSSENCYISAKPGTLGSLPRPCCLGCALTSRLTHANVYPAMSTQTQIGGSGKWSKMMFKITQCPADARDKVIDWFVNSCTLDSILKPLGTRSMALFMYECNGHVYKVDEVPGAGYGLAGIRQLKPTAAQIRDIKTQCTRIDETLYKEKYSLGKCDTGFMAFECASNGGYRIRVSANSTDRRIIPTKKVIDTVRALG